MKTFGSCRTLNIKQHMSTNLHFAIEVRNNKGAWETLEWYSKHPSLYNKEPEIWSLWSRYGSFFRMFRKNKGLIRSSWREIPKSLVSITKGYYKDVKDAPAYDKAVPFGNGVLYKHTVLDYDNSRFRDEYICGDWSDSHLGHRGLPSDVTPNVKRFASEKWNHSTTHFLLSELFDAVDKNGMELKAKIRDFYNGSLLAAIADKLGVDRILYDSRYEGCDFDKFIDEFGDAYSSGLSTYEHIRAIVDEVYDVWPHDNNIRVIVWAS